MKKNISAIMIFAMLMCINSVGNAAELLDVKPVVSGSAVSIEILADIAMTYTFYKVPGQARAVVDIAEVDPEKIEPLIVVNKGAISSISVDKALISGLVVSRIIFNLVSESDIAVSATPDRKRLTVTFGSAPSAAGKPDATPQLKPEPAPVQPPEPVAKVESPTPPPATVPEEDPLGLEEPVAATAAPAAKASVAAAAGGATLLTAPTTPRIPKLEPVVPVTHAQTSALAIKDITTGASYIYIRTNQPVGDFKSTRITDPERLIIDIACEKINQKAQSVAIKKFGITKARIGISPKNIRIVLDSGKAGFPAHTISKTNDGLRINFK